MLVKPRIAYHGPSADMPEQSQTNHISAKTASMGVDSPHHCPDCKKNAVQRCVDLGHMFKCPRHPEAYCRDKEGETCVLCVEGDRRWERDQSKEKRIVREAQVAAALAARADTLAAGKIRWGDKVPTVNKLARTEAIKAQLAFKMTNAQNVGNRKAEKPWKGGKGGNLAKVQQTEGIKVEETLKTEKDKLKAKPRLRIQRGR